LPSRAACSDVAFLVADVHPPQPDAASTEARVEAALEQWEQITSKRRPTAEDVGALARRHRIRRGKWLAFPKTQEEADAAWAAVVRAAAGGLLGSCCQVKVSSTNPREEGYVLMAYTEDYLDQEAVAATADALRCALPRLRDPRLLYKADIFTFLGIYAKNEYNLKPTVYTAQL